MKRLSCSLALAAMVASGASFASSTTDIRVTGTITPPACTTSLTGGGVFDLGTRYTRNLHQDKLTSIPGVTQVLSVTCTAATYLALQSFDHRTDSRFLALRNTFGLGESRGRKLGLYQAVLRDIRVDNTLAKSYYSEDDGTSWSEFPGNTGLFQHDEAIVAFGSIYASQPTAITRLTTTLEVNAYIAPLDELDMTDEAPIDGAMTLEIVYL